MTGSDVPHALRRLRASQWDDRTHLLRLAPGTVPGVDVDAFGLHVIRESALSAYLDCLDGEIDRAEATLGAVLGHQYDHPGTPWHGTFRVTAEQADPPHDAAEWFHYDPNWRQFVGTILALCIIDHDRRLDPRLVDRIVDAIVLAVDGEPDDRIPDWYTNPNLLHAWLQAWTGRRIADDTLTDAGEARARRVIERFHRIGDVDEYNSPTYDGIDCWAAALWTSLPPTPFFGSAGPELLTTIGGRLARFHRSDLHAIGGPYLRTYGFDLRRYVSQAAMWLALAGRPADSLLPPILDRNTDHIHDLWFWPVFDRFASVVTPHLHAQSDPSFRHVQHLTTISATSVFTSDGAIGLACGPVPEFSSSQYAPLTVHLGDADVRRDGPGRWLAVMPETGLRAVDGEVTDDLVVRGTFRGSDDRATTAVLLVSSHPLDLGDTTASLPGIALTCGTPVTFDRQPTDHLGHRVVVTLVGDATPFTVVTG